jgi:hypothetical protein
LPAFNITTNGKAGFLHIAQEILALGFESLGKSRFLDISSRLRRCGWLGMTKLEENY